MNLNEIKRVEVIRGPASAVWGANALLRRRERDYQGAARNVWARFTLGLGGFDRSTSSKDRPLEQSST